MPRVRRPAGKNGVRPDPLSWMSRRTLSRTMDTYWVPGVNHLGTYGRWAFAEFTEVYQIESDFKAKVESDSTR